MMAFAKAEGVNNFILEGPIDDVPTFFEFWVGLFPHPIKRGSSYLIAQQGDWPIPATYSRILKLKVPQRVLDLGIKRNIGVRRTLERRFAREGMPSIMLAIGHAKDSEEELISLFSVQGVPPEEALGEIKEAVSRALTKLN